MGHGHGMPASKGARRGGSHLCLDQTHVALENSVWFIDSNGLRFPTKQTYKKLQLFLWSSVVYKNMKTRAF